MSGRKLLCLRPMPAVCGGEASLVRTWSLKPGAELIVDRLGYRHHGIYIGAGLVIHYAGRVNSWRGHYAPRTLEIGRAPL
jgi:hypothetical protein